MYAKLKSNGQIQQAPNPLKVTISNPTDKQYEDFGYHKVVNTPAPAYDENTQYVNSHYEMQGEEIVQVWEIVDIPADEIVEE